MTSRNAKAKGTMSQRQAMAEHPPAKGTERARRGQASDGAGWRQHRRIDWAAWLYRGLAWAFPPTTAEAPLGRRRILELLTAAALVVITTGLIHAFGHLPSPLTHLYYIPISFVAARFTLPWALLIAFLASLASSPALVPLGMEMGEGTLPIKWLTWPILYFLVAIMTSVLTQQLRREGQTLTATTERLKRVQELEQRMVQEVETLGRIDHIILRGDPEDVAMQEITELAGALTQAKVCAIMMTSPDGYVRARSYYGFSRQIYQRAINTIGPLTLGEGAAGWAILTGRTATVTNAFTDPRYEPRRPLAQILGYVSAMAVPIRIADRTIGALFLGYDQERDFSPAEIEQVERLAHQAAIAIQSARQRDALGRLTQETVCVLAEAIESRDPYTGGHVSRLSANAVLVARRLGLKPQQIEVISLGAALHDAGKVIVPDAILKKPGPLTPEEFAIIKQHCYAGGQICKKVSFLQEMYPIVYHHHERWDGNGYPDGLRNEEIPLGARIVAVADAYDAITNDRPYRPARAHQEALRILREGAGSQWDPRVVECFMDILAGRNGH